MKTGLPKWWVGDVGLRLPSAAISHANYDLPDCVRLMARWLATRPEVSKVLHPGLESDPGHAIWQRDFTGASGLFSIVLKPAPQQAVDALLDTVKLFGMGYSWGGFESLIIPFDCSDYRTATKWTPGGPTLRLHIGLEHVDDLKADLERGFAALNAG
jgi:cystathionine beta-lyase